MLALRWIEYDLLGWDAMEEYLMGCNEESEVKLWGSDDCPECQVVKEYFEGTGYKYYDVNTLVSGDRPDIEAMTQLSFQDMRLPLINVDGEWVDPKEIKQKIASRVA